MTQRRTPSGQGPARRPDRAGRAGVPRPGRAASRDPGARSEPRQGPVRASGNVRASGSTRGTGASRSADGPRSGSRPGAARRTGAARTVKRTYAQQPRRYTGRATVLAGVLVALALAYTYPVRVYLNQQSDIARIEAAQQAQRKLIGDLTEEAALWDDPEYVKIQARERFFMVLPGEVPLVVLTDHEGAARDAGVVPDSTQRRTPDPWYDTLWSSIQAANEQERAGQ
ncbi:septum formation initiator family protein [Plantactinospora solaniradicis]|uniref:Septum formation initiator family protein n=1 Tax=Plantactinospora solaniradicis TaxID=1723736 RepID=A0ABW1KGK6_9ACTN